MSIQDHSGQDAGAPPEDVFAGEYVLGVLDAGQRREAERRRASEPGFAEAVLAWEAHFAPWLAKIPPVAVPPHLWPRIRSRLGWSAVDGGRRGIWDSVGFWRGATAVAAAATLAVILIVRPPAHVEPPGPPPIAVQPRPAPPAAVPARPVTVLARDDGAAAWIASVAPARDTLLMVPVPAPADAAGRVDELWIIPSGGAPLSLGMVSRDQAHSLAIPVALRDAFAAGAILAITLEPRAGIPHAAPTGPIIAKGVLANL